MRASSSRNIVRLVIGVVCLVAVVCATLPAAASETDSRWYGWQPMISDGASAALITGGVEGFVDYNPLFAIGLGTYLLGAPTIHFAHGQFLQGSASFGLRLGLPLVGLGVAWAVSEDPIWPVLDIVPVVGLVSGAVAAALIDWFVLSFDSNNNPSGEQNELTTPRLQFQWHF